MILGGGTGGTLAANRLRRAYPPQDAGIAVVDQDTGTDYQPGLLFVPFGQADLAHLVRPRQRQLRDGISFRHAGIDHVDLATDRVHLDDGQVLDYDVLVVATGARLLPGETEGLTGPGWMKDVFTSTRPTARPRCTRRWSGSPAAGSWSTSLTCRSSARSRRWSSASSRTTISGSAACGTGSGSGRHAAGRRLHQAGLQPGTERPAGREGHRPGHRVQHGRGGRRPDRGRPPDLLRRPRGPVRPGRVIPLHGGAAYVERSPGLGDELGFIPVDPATLQAKAAPNVFALGDATDVPTSKAGSVAHFEGDALVANVRRFLAGQPPAERPLRRALHWFFSRGWQGPAHRLQLRDRAAPRALSRPPAPSPDARVPPEPPGQAGVPAVLLAQPAAWLRRPRHQLSDARARQEPPAGPGCRRGLQRSPMITARRC